MNIKIGLAQINSSVGDFLGNEEKICQDIQLALKQSCDLLVFPELSVCGYPVWDLANKGSFVKACSKSIKRIAKKTRNVSCYVALGTVTKGKNGKSFNSVQVLHRGKIVYTQHKSLLPTYDVFLEEIFFDSDNRRVPLEIKGNKIGFTICEDIWDKNYEDKPAADLVKKGADAIINISASPFHQLAFAERSQILVEKSKKHKVPFFYCNLVGGQDHLVFDGRSIVSNAKGHIVYVGNAFSEELRVFGLNYVNRAKKVSTKEDPIALMYQALVTGIRDYVNKNNFTQVVVGLSGGIDSALTAALAVDALGKDAVLGVAMPSMYSSEDSKYDAELLADNLGIEFRVQSIEGMYEAFTKQRYTIHGGKGLAWENLQARLRGLLLMFISNNENRLVLSTGNKSEMATGYCTLYGDMCGGLSVLADIYKTDVYRLSNYRNREDIVIPLSTINKEPSAELKPDQKDSDSLPEYALLDNILRLYVEENMSSSEIEKKLRIKSSRPNHPSIVKWVINRVDHNEYKRQQSAPGIRVTKKAWFGRRMPITNRFQPTT